MERLESRSCPTRLRLPADLVVEILLRLPAKSVARFRCVSSAWLSISNDPSFVFAHARRGPKSLLVYSSPWYMHKPRHLLFSFSASSINKQRVHQISHVSESSCDGLVLFLRRFDNHPSKYFVLNLLTCMHYDLPNPSMTDEINYSILKLYHHRWAGEYRVINLPKSKHHDLDHIDCEVLSLGHAYSWRKIRVKAPFISLFHLETFIQVNDNLYWICSDNALQTRTILAFDILRETFSIIECPSYIHSYCLRYGLVDIEGSLCCWIIYKNKSRQKIFEIDIWVAVDGDKKWKKIQSSSFNDELMDPHPIYYYLYTNWSLCINESELLILFTNNLLHWDLKSSNFWVEQLFPRFFDDNKYSPQGSVFTYFPLTYIETLVNV